MSKSEETQIPLKILVDKGSNRVLFAEADHSFIDILFGFLTLPLETIVRLVGENPSIGSLNTLYEGLANLSTECFWTEECKEMLLNPRNSSASYCSQLKLNVEDTIPTKYFMCGNTTRCTALAKGSAVFSTCDSAKCSSCGKKLNWEVSLPQKSVTDMDRGNTGTFVNEAATFIITDDLHIKPNSLNSSFQTLSDLGIIDITNIEERTMYIGLQQVLKLLSLALFTNTPLTNLLSLALFTNTPLTNLLLREGKAIQEFVECEPSNLTRPRMGKVWEEPPANARNSMKFYAKAFVSNSNGELLFLQAEGDFIDFLFSFLAIPLGAVQWFLNGTTYVPPCIDNLYTSLSNLSVGQCMRSQDVKDMLLDPPLPLQYMCKNQIFTLNEPSALRYYYYNCGFRETSFITPSEQTQLGTCECLTLKDPRLDGEFVRGAAMFMVTDDLTVTPISSISTLSYLSKLKIPLSDLEEHEVSIGVEEGLEILKASLTCSSALTHGLKHLLVKKPKQEN